MSHESEQRPTARLKLVLGAFITNSLTPLGLAAAIRFVERLRFARRAGPGGGLLCPGRLLRSSVGNEEPGRGGMRAKGYDECPARTEHGCGASGWPGTPAAPNIECVTHCDTPPPFADTE